MTQDSAKRKKVWEKILCGLLATAVVLCAAITFPSIWGPQIATAVVKTILPHNSTCSNDFTVKKIGLSSIEVINASFRAFPTAPAFSYLKVDYTLQSLLHKTINSVELRGVSLDPSYPKHSIALPKPANKANPPASADPLQGWTIKKASLETTQIELSDIIPAKLHHLFPSTSAQITIAVENPSENYHGTISGQVLGGEVNGELNYTPKTGNGTIGLNYHPILSNETSLGAQKIASSFAFFKSNKLGFNLQGETKLFDNTLCLAHTLRSDDTGATLSLLMQNQKITQESLPAKIIFHLIPLPDTVTDIFFDINPTFKFVLKSTEKETKYEGELTISDCSIALKNSDLPITANHLTSRLRFDGSGTIFRIKPFPVFLQDAKLGNIKFGKSSAFINADEDNLVISQAAVNFAGGFLRLYALYLNFKELQSGFTIEVDSLELKELLQQFPDLKDADATGKLYGRMPLRIVRGAEIRLRDAFVYSPPGEIGNVSIPNSERLSEILSQSGLPAPATENLAKALKNLNYKTLRLDLNQPKNGDGLLAIKLEGESKSGKITTPVNINISVNGPIERLLNLSIKTTRGAK